MLDSKFNHLTYGECCRIAQAIGLSLGEYEGRDNDSRGLAFTVCGGKLINGHEAAPWIWGSPGIGWWIGCGSLGW